jgi:hypothetical protein
MFLYKARCSPPSRISSRSSILQYGTQINRKDKKECSYYINRYHNTVSKKGQIHQMVLLIIPSCQGDEYQYCTVGRYIVKMLRKEHEV